MRLEKTGFVLLLLAVSIFAFSSSAQVVSPSEIPQTSPEEEVRRFLDEYVARYNRMDIDGFMALFSKRGIENRMLPYDDIYEVYRKHFSNSQSLSYSLNIYFVQPHTRSAFVSGRYEVVQSLKSKGQQSFFRGNIQWHLVREDGSLKIKEIDYGRDRTR